MLIDTLYNKFVYSFFTHYILMLSFKKLEKIVYPNIYPKLLKKIPSHYKYKFQSNFAIAGIENFKCLDNQINDRIEKVKLYEKYLDKNLKITNYDSYEINSFLEYPILLKKKK